MDGIEQRGGILDAQDVLQKPAGEEIFRAPGLAAVLDAVILGLSAASINTDLAAIVESRRLDVDDAQRAHAVLGGQRSGDQAQAADEAGIEELTEGADLSGSRMPLMRKARLSRCSLRTWKFPCCAESCETPGNCSSTFSKGVLLPCGSASMASRLRWWAPCQPAQRYCRAVDRIFELAPRRPERDRGRGGRSGMVPRPPQRRRRRCRVLRGAGVAGRAAAAGVAAGRGCVDDGVTVIGGTGVVPRCGRRPEAAGRPVAAGGVGAGRSRGCGCCRCCGRGWRRRLEPVLVWVWRSRRRAWEHLADFAAAAQEQHPHAAQPEQRRAAQKQQTPFTTRHPRPLLVFI